MAKYHISLNGTPAICLADSKPCPRASECHFEASSPEEAQLKVDQFNERKELASKNLTPIMDAIYNVGDFERPDGTTLRDHLEGDQKLAYDYYKEVRALYKDDEHNFYNTIAHLTREGKIDKDSSFYEEFKDDALYIDNFDLEKAVMDNSSALKTKKSKTNPDSVVLKTDKRGFFRKNYMVKVLSDPNTTVTVVAEYTDDYAYDAETNFRSGRVLSDNEKRLKAELLDSKYSSMKVDENYQLKYYEFGNSYIIDNPNIIVDGVSLQDKKIEQRKNELKNLQTKGILDKSVNIEEKIANELSSREERLKRKKEKSNIIYLDERRNKKD